MTTATAHDRIAMAVIDKWLRFRIDHCDLPGLQICIRKSGEILLSAAYGKANVATGEVFTTKHLSHIASHSKMFASCAIHMLVRDGKLRLDQPLVEILPELKAHKDARVAEITIRDVITNRSGIIRDGLESPFWDLLEPPFPGYEELIKDIMAADLVYAPNTKTKYSNWAYSLVGLIVERASGQEFAKFVHERILSKLPGAAILPDYVEDSGMPFASGHSRADATGRRLVLKHKAANGMAAATGFCADMESISLFLYTLLFTDKLLPRAVRREFLHMNWPVANSKTERYGLGFQVSQLDDFLLIGHSGGFMGFNSTSRHWMFTDYSVSVVLNTHDAPLSVAKAVFEIIDKITNTFSEDDLKTAVVSDVMVNRWSATVYVVADRKAQSFSAETWTPCLEQQLLERQADDGYTAPKANGLTNIGEMVRFGRDENGIALVRHGSQVAYREAEYMALSSDARAG